MGKQKIIINDFERSTTSYMKEIGASKPLSYDEEIALWKKYKNDGDLSARDKIIKSNLKFVAKIANSYRGRGLSYSDLIAEGNLGLIKSLDYFDETKGNRILSYSVWWIKQMMMEAIEKRNGMVYDDLPYDTDCDIFDDEETGNKAGNTKIPEVEEETSDSDLRTAIFSLLDILNEREQTMICMYYGLNGENPSTLEEIGDYFGLTKERVRQINDKSIKKIRSYALTKNVQADIYKR